MDPSINILRSIGQWYGAVLKGYKEHDFGRRQETSLGFLGLVSGELPVNDRWNFCHL